MVWRTLLNNTWKGRIVIDIRALNKISMLDAYPVPSQVDILSIIQGAKYISTIDCSAYFYQWRVNPEHQHRLTVASHCGQETFKVAIMGYRNTPAYIQRMTDRILWPHRDYSCTYIDNIVIYSATLTEHLQHLWNVFQELANRRICLSSEKSFLDYFLVQLLGQWVDALGLATLEVKLAAIINLEFLRTLTQLEHYLELTGYLRQYVS